MNKTVTINLAGLVFNIEEAAYEKLKSYLDSIKKHFSSMSADDEIVNDIESRIAEQFSALISEAKQVITGEDVLNLIKVMGTVADINREISEEDAVSREEEEAKAGGAAVKKLMRSSDDVIVAGVCSGLAAYLGIDPVIARLIFFISIFFGGTGLVVYLVLWLIMPQAKTATDKIEMRGETVTLSGIEETIKEKFKTVRPGGENRLAKLLLLPFRLAGKIVSLIGLFLKKLVPIIFSFVGIIILIGSALAIASVMFVAANILFNANSPYIEFPIKEFLSGSIYLVAVISGFLAAFIPLVFLIKLGATLVNKKSAFNIFSSLTLIFLWFMALVSLGVIAIRVAPDWQEKINTMEKTDSITRNYQLKDFTKIEADSRFELNISRGENYKIEAAGPSKAVEALGFKINGDSLEIYRESENKICIFCWPVNYRAVKIDIVMPSLSYYKGNGLVNANISGFKEEKGEFILDGLAKLELKSAYDSLKFKLDGVSAAEVAGSSTDLSIKIDGTSKLDAFALPVLTAEIDADGLSVVKVNASKQLNISSDGLAKIYYMGEPQIIKDSDGASQVEKLLQENMEFENKTATSNEELIIDSEVMEDKSEAINGLDKNLLIQVR